MSSWPIRQGTVFGIFPPDSPPPHSLWYQRIFFFLQGAVGAIIIP